MEKFSINFTAEDMAELITVIRVEKQRKNLEAFSKVLGIKPETLDLIEDGKSVHIINTIQKCIDLGYIKNVELHFEFNE